MCTRISSNWWNSRKTIKRHMRQRYRVYRAFLVHRGLRNWYYSNFCGSIFRSSVYDLPNLPLSPQKFIALLKMLAGRDFTTVQGPEVDDYHNVMEEVSSNWASALNEMALKSRLEIIYPPSICLQTRGQVGCT